MQSVGVLIFEKASIRAETGGKVRFSGFVFSASKALTTDLTINGKLNISGCGGVGTARHLGCRDRTFESCHSDQKCGFDRRESRKVGILCGFLLTKKSGNLLYEKLIGWKRHQYSI